MIKSVSHDLKYFHCLCLSWMWKYKKLPIFTSSITQIYYSCLIAKLGRLWIFFHVLENKNLTDLSSLTRTFSSVRNKSTKSKDSNIPIILLFMSALHSFPVSGFWQDGQGRFLSRWTRPTRTRGYSTNLNDSVHDIFILKFYLLTFYYI